MKKKFGYFFVTICLTLLVLYLFRYKRALVIEDKIPSMATAVVQVNLRQIEHHLLVDAIKNPSKYISFRRKRKGAVSLKKTIIIPRNLLFFTNTSNLKDAWISSFVSIRDSAKLKTYLLQEGFEESTDERFRLFKRDRLVIGIANGKLVIVYRKQQNQPIIGAIQTVFDEVSFYKKNTDLMKSISNLEGDISYANVEADFLEFDFKNGLFEIKGKIQSDLFKADMHAEHSENSIGFIGAKINKNHVIFQSFLSDKNKTKFDEFTKLSIDSIVSKWNGSMAFNLKAIDQKMDTIITYEYDDDFNKIEKKSIQELNIPNLRFSLGEQAKLYTYFYENNAVQIIENDTLFTSIPLYKLYAAAGKNSFELFTEKKFHQASSKSLRYKLNAHLNIEKYLKNPLEFSFFPSNNEYMQFLRDVSIKYGAKNDLSVKVNLKNDRRNFLGQLVKH